MNPLPLSELRLTDGLYYGPDGQPFTGTATTRHLGSDDLSLKAKVSDGLSRGRSVSYGYEREVISEAYTETLPMLAGTPKDVRHISGWISREAQYFSYGLNVIVDELPEQLLAPSVVMAYHRAGLDVLPPPTQAVAVEEIIVHYRTGDFEPPLTTERHPVN